MTHKKVSATRESESVIACYGALGIKRIQTTLRRSPHGSGA